MFDALGNIDNSMFAHAVFSMEDMKVSWENVQKCICALCTIGMDFFISLWFRSVSYKQEQYN